MRKCNDFLKRLYFVGKFHTFLGYSVASALALLYCLFLLPCNDVCRDFFFITFDEYFV